MAAAHHHHHHHHEHHHHGGSDDPAQVFDRSRLPDPPTLSPVALRDPKETATLARRLRDGWERVLAHVPPESTRDFSVYTGLGGVAYLALRTALLLRHRQQRHPPPPDPAALATPLQRLHSDEAEADVHWVRSQSPGELLAVAGRYLAAAEAALERSLRRGGRRDVTFVMGGAGIHAQLALLHRLQGDEAAAQAAVQKVVATANDDELADKPFELLYGASGYLTALLFLRAHGFTPQEVPDAVVARVARGIVDGGEDGPGDSLRYFWHDTNYMGGAHGASGIMLALLDAQALVPSALSPEHKARVRATVEYIRTLRLPTGNYPTRPDQEPGRDRLVQWCHGAPGPLLLFARAYETWNDPRYLAWAEDAADVVWARGFLRKGNGLCHGVAGNAYCFLACYRTTGRNERYLHRARQFALAAEEPQFAGQQGTPDHPYSLFEGLGGLLNLYIDLVLNPHPASARFPAVEMGVAGVAAGGGE